MDKVIVYTSTNCPHCRQVKGYLADKGIEFEERNIEQNDEYAQQVWDMGVRAVPLTVIGENRVLGMNTTQFEKFLNQQ
ncbi:glutaredoxin family protein [Paenibacillus cellulositrophicus]|jgi:glutaredoxin|uniref:Glutaredoxin n=1 Tax=Paenibacillus favisporus TaxID=221028 RepID=A0ABV2FDK0_9BACL|nr:MULTISPECIES: glutaredoxin family protein [Paenibacillus]MBJ9992473.1 glutaredoxin family protein [Paenibacillus sp. S28]MCM3002069.1 glutaredoxin family protein [Paenibacillus cellulositrophicus]OXL87221.1 NrdH-redoxin [Paenibacillus sp. SSG-1]OZB90451.1 glutaredoxin family protein [Paenibacillus sp. XY044]PQP86730.1 glutaredoxin family protein [Paenibacillus sp. AR247]